MVERESEQQICFQTQFHPSVENVSQERMRIKMVKESTKEQYSYKNGVKPSLLGEKIIKAKTLDLMLPGSF